ncbi:hypothetical protein H0X90_26685 [Burkholderia sp. 9775_39]|uniref:hypothetical protein n=1 Tax=unclassified Burkholderia TaxID=2613784 RepID=UPI0018C3DEA9|nr:MULTISPECIES: hypothetical protein [unclassified Burkholderia]MBG0880389.1 hypothetical protein [Burkholderia sp. 9775_39]MBG0886214.1 hypothetical protein [Burkholderia sp. 9773_38]
MSIIGGLPSTIGSGYRALPFVLRRLVLVLVYSLVFTAGAFMHNHGAGDIASLFLLVGAIGTLWAAGAWRVFKVVLLLVLVIVGD